MQTSEKRDQEINLLLPDKSYSDENPEVSIVIPAVNEEITIGESVDWCKEGLKKANVKGQILIVDSSTDKTAEIALAHGAEVLKTPKRGLGRAYIDAIPYIRGKYVLMGDADLTYDFREIAPFIAKFREGYEYVMGSRFKGTIDKDAMPPLHQYFGTPVTTWILNQIYGSKLSDIHCGMRGITFDCLKRMGLQSQSWQYASEMIIKAMHMELKTAEVPVIFHKDRPGRVSHYKRTGWWEPWRAGWISLETQFVHGADFFLLKPGIILGVPGWIIVLAIGIMGPVRIGALTLSTHWMLIGLLCGVIGLQAFYMGILAGVMYDVKGNKSKKWAGVFEFNRCVIICSLLIIASILLVIPIIKEYIFSNFSLEPSSHSSLLAIMGFGGATIAFLTFTHSLLLSAIISVKNWRTSMK